MPSQTNLLQSSRRRENSHLRPEDAYHNTSPPHRTASPLGRSDTVTANNHTSHRHRNRSSSRRRAAARRVSQGTWRKLLWVKQSFPDNYTDEATFLDHLQWNPRWRPYEFWPLVADSTIIVQHVCSVIIFICCFTGIFTRRVSPQLVVGWATIATVIGWVFKDYWQHRQRNGNAGSPASPNDDRPPSGDSFVSEEAEFGQPFHEIPSSAHSRTHSNGSVSLTSPGGHSYASSPIQPPSEAVSTLPSYIPPYGGTPSPFSPHMQERLTTAKSAILIYCSLLGLSPILKSLTLSTSSDSIWALSSWLMGINVFTFDYGAGPEVKFPASLSTNAALMASTVLASRLESTTDVFSLSLFSIEVFGLFPVFRRHLRHHSWMGHLGLTAVLVVFASGGLSMIISGGGWGWGIVGVVLGSILTCLTMGVTSWWLIGLQRYKNEIHGPWDPARPIIRRHWD